MIVHAAVFAIAVLGQSDEVEKYELELRVKNAEHRSQFADGEIKRLREMMPRQIQSADVAAASLRTLKNLRITVDAQSTPLADLLASWSKHSGLTFKIDPEVGKDWAKEQVMSIKVVDILMESMLKLCLQPSQFDFVATVSGEILISTKERCTALARKTVTAPALIDYILSYAPASDAARAAAEKRLRELLPRLDSDDPDAREDAHSQIVHMGRGAHDVLKTLAWEAKTADGGARVKEIVTQFDAARAATDPTGLQRDVLFLAQIDDPRARERLKRILGGVRPFDTDGMPEGAGAADYLCGWWAWAQHRVTWDAAKDAYVRK